jgi:hypothetical protein
MAQYIVIAVNSAAAARDKAQAARRQALRMRSWMR